MFIALPGSIIIAGIVGYISEKSGFTRNGYLQSIIICIGGAVLFFFVRVMFGFGFATHGWNAIASSIGALIIIPTHFRR